MFMRVATMSKFSKRIVLFVVRWALTWPRAVTGAGAPILAVTGWRDLPKTVEKFVCVCGGGGRNVSKSIRKCPKKSLPT